MRDCDLTGGRAYGIRAPLRPVLERLNLGDKPSDLSYSDVSTCLVDMSALSSVPENEFLSSNLPLISIYNFAPLHNRTES